MKKIILILLLNISFTLCAQAPIGWYVLGGINQTTLKSDYLTADPSLGYNIGIIFPMGYHETYNFQFEFLATQKALNFKTLGATYENVSDSKYSTPGIEIGFYTNYYILTPDEDKLFIGPQVGIMASFNSQILSADDINEELLLPYLLKSNELQNLPQLNAALGLGITGGYNRFKFELRYNLGLTNILSLAQLDDFDESNTYRGQLLEGKLNTISLNVSYLIFKRIKRR